VEAVDRLFHRDQGSHDGIAWPVAATGGIREVVMMDGQFAQAPHGLQAYRDRAALVTHELVGEAAERRRQVGGKVMDGPCRAPGRKVLKGRIGRGG